MRLMEVRTIRAWHYTRITDTEIDVLRQNGIYPYSLYTIARGYPLGFTGVDSGRWAEE